MPTWTKEVVDLSVAGAALTIDNIKIDGSNIGHTSDTDLLTLASNLLTVSGALTISGTSTFNGAVVLGSTINGATLGLDSDSELKQSTGTGLYNTTFGKHAGDSIASGGNYNSAFGENAGTSITTGDYNTSFGYNSGAAVVGNNHNTSIGYESLLSTTGLANTGLGSMAMRYATSTDYCTAVGTYALYGIDGTALTGNGNTGIGYKAGYRINGTAYNNTFVGAQSAGDASQCTGTANTGVGNSSLADIDAGSYNTAIGSFAMKDLDSGNHNTSLGYTSLYVVTEGDYNTAIGSKALEAVTSGDKNTAVGYQALLSNTAASNTAVGAYSGNHITSGTYNTSVGYEALFGNSGAKTTGNSNTAVGTRAGYLIQDSAASNTLIGSHSGEQITTSQQSTGLGKSSCGAASASPLTGNSNVALGYYAGAYMQGAANDNCFVGTASGRNQTTAANNVAMGSHSLYSNLTGTAVTATGHYSLYHALEDHNSAYGYHSGKYVEAGEYNTFIGSRAGEGKDEVSSEGAGTARLDGDSNTLVGYKSGYQAIKTTASNTAVGSQSLGGGVDNASGMVCTHNTAVGTSAGYSITTGSENTLIGRSAGAALTTSNTEVYVGAYAGDATTTGTGNVAMGYSALSSATTNSSNADGKPVYNVAVGYKALEDMNDTDETSSYGRNTAVGNTSMTNLTTGKSNTAVGNASMGLGVTTGNYNVAVGQATLYDLTSGEYNIGIGKDSCGNLTHGDYNIGLGAESLLHCKPADGSGFNVAIGSLAGRGGSVNASASATDSDGVGNTFVGHKAGWGNSIALEGNYNVGLGLQAGQSLQGAATQNTFVGSYAGNTTTTGGANTIIGYNCEASGATAFKQIVIGASLNGTADDAVFIGDDGDHIRCDWGTDATWDKVSDKRKKNVLGDSSLGLDFINDLNTVQFTFKAPSEYPKEWTSYDKDKTEPRNTEVQHGLLAQDVKKALDNAGIDTFSGWSEDPDGCQRIGESAFVIPLIKAVQELSEKVRKLENKE